MAYWDFHFLQLLNKCSRDCLTPRSHGLAPRTGVAGALADLLEVRPDEGVPCPELVEVRGHRFASFGRLSHYMEGRQQRSAKTMGDGACLQLNAKSEDAAEGCGAPYPVADK